MALYNTFAASSKSSIAPSNILQFSKTNVITNVMTMSAQKWSIDRHHTLISKPSKHYNHPSRCNQFSDENQDGQDGSYIECYMKDNYGSSVKSAREHVHHMISDTWKRLNQESLSPNPFSASFIKGSLNVARMVQLMYDYDDHQCLPDLEQHMKSLLNEKEKSFIC